MSVYFINPYSFAGVSYLLRATFDAANQGYANAQVLNTEAEGVQDGQLTVVEVDGTLAIVSNKMAFTAQSTPVWGDLGLIGELLGGGAFTKALGMPLLGTINLTTWEEAGLGWDNAATVADPDNMVYALQANATDGQIDVEGGTVVLTGLSTSTAYKLALVLGGYDSSGTPYYSGQTKADYKYGAAYYYHDGSNWHLLWRKTTDNTGTLYAAFSSLDAAGTLDEMKVHNSDLSAVQIPAHYSSFDASNGTSLDAITPEVGTGWTEQNGNWDIQGNEADPGNGFSSDDHATTSSSESDAIIDCGATATRTDASNYSTAAIVVRWSDTTHFWLTHLSPEANKFQIYENNAGYTLRAEAAITINGGTKYAVRTVADGTTIDAYLDGANKITYASASLNVTAKIHGLRVHPAGTPPANPTFDNFTVYARTSTTYNDELDAV